MEERNLKHQTWLWREEQTEYKPQDVGHWTLRLLTWNPGRQGRQNLRVGNWIRWAPVVCLQEFDPRNIGNEFDAWNYAKNPDTNKKRGYTAVACRKELGNVELVKGRVVYRPEDEDDENKWSMDWMIANIEFVNDFLVKNLRVSPVHYESVNARKRVRPSVNNLVEYLDEAWYHYVDIIGLDGNQTCYPQDNFEKSAWDMAWETFCASKNLPLPIRFLGDLDKDCVGFWVTPWSQLLQCKGAKYGAFNISNEQLGLRKRDSDSHHIMYASFKIRHHGNRSAAANVKRRQRYDEYWNKRARSGYRLS